MRISHLALLAGAVVGSLGYAPFVFILAIILTIVSILRRPLADVASHPVPAASGSGMGEVLASRWTLRAALAAPLALAIAFFSYSARLGGPDRIDDRAGVLDRRQASRFETHLRQINYESNVDMRFVLVDSAEETSLDDFTARRARSLEIAAEQRRALFVLDPSRRQLRVVVGAGLQDVFSSSFVEYLTRHHAHSFAAVGDANLGLRLTLRMLQARIRRAALGEEYDPRAAAVIEERAARAMAAETDAGDRFVPQPTVDGAFQLYLEWLLDGRRDGDVPLFTAESRAHLAKLPVNRALAESDLLLEYGSAYDVVVRDSVALLYFTDDPLATPHFYRRSEAGWQMDILAEVEHTREHAVGPLAWTIVERDDDIEIGLPDGTVVSGSVAGRDPTTDLALVRAPGAGLHAPQWRSPEGLRPGHLAVVLSRPGTALRAQLSILSAVAPAGSGTVIVTVVAPDGSISSPGQPFTYTGTASGTSTTGGAWTSQPMTKDTIAPAPASTSRSVTWRPWSGSARICCCSVVSRMPELRTRDAREAIEGVPPAYLWIGVGLIGAALLATLMRNRLPGIVLRVVKDRVPVEVEVQVGAHRLVSLVTREAVDALRLEPGMPAVVSVKATNVAIELPGRRHAD